MLLTFLKAIVVGIIVSAPMGPVGMLCVRRTMLYGHRQGMLTGLGAALSDLLYAALTLVGVGAFVGFIERYEYWLQLGGSVFVILFAIWVMRNKQGVVDASHKRHKGKGSKGQTPDRPKSDRQIFWSAFFLTFSNVLIVLLYIGLFAQFQFVTEGDFFTQIIPTLLGITVGALGWWFGITHVLVKVKAWLNVKSLKTFNYVLGSLLLLFGVVGVLSSLAQL